MSPCGTVCARSLWPRRARERPSVAPIYWNAIRASNLTRCRDARMVTRSAPASARRGVIVDLPQDQMLVRPQNLQLDARSDRDHDAGGGASDPLGPRTERKSRPRMGVARAPTFLHCIDCGVEFSERGTTRRAGLSRRPSAVCGAMTRGWFSGDAESWTDFLGGRIIPRPLAPLLAPSITKGGQERRASPVGAMTL